MVHRSLTFICQYLRLIDSGQHSNLSASIYLCLAELCATLKIYSIGELPSFMPHVLQTYQSENFTKNELLLTSVIACLSKLVRTLCNYLTPYLSDIIKRTCTLLTHPACVTDQRLRTMWSHIALHVPHRLLFPILYDVIDKNEFELNDLEPLMTLLKQSLSIATSDDLSSNYSLLKKLFLKLFTLRTMHTKKMPPNKMNIYEDYIFECFAELVMRLSEETFRPLFYTIYEWAVYNEPPAEYTLTFYRLTLILSKRLKGLFTLFAGHIIQHSSSILNQLNTSKLEDAEAEFKINFRKKYVDENKIELINGILGSISNLCLFDSVGFINDERFQLLMMPIVDQMENFTSTDDYAQWIQQNVAPCIVNLTAATKEESLWRKIHYQILLKTRSNLSKVRLATLIVIQEMSRKLGMNYQSLLAEAVPFMTELMEDPNDEVEKTCHRVIVDMESTLGESLQDYFNN
ncbi:unnamed protein product [Rotaria magnacalcarata]|uniref:HEAT repeat-containing protein 1 n=4 Tax=Rotaria magnacalcarata TaxID=392030 RepID=A0A816EE00_9BILA|nr:unnamed protein product [Rotaria magnacalcarata]CAF1647814.1 unnamed protein product [Rotaria magnacalcarata]CAF3804341.1 unnamed protein product [Rotaria magnacalcarata]